MSNICLVACTRTKKSELSSAEDLYISSLFLKSRDIARSDFDKWFILSAKHGLLNPNEVIEPYEQSLHHMPLSEKQSWAKKVMNSLTQVANPGDTITFLAGLEYRRHLLPLLTMNGFSVSTPMQGLSIGRQLQWLNCQVQERHLKQDLDRFYSLLAVLETGLGGKRKVVDCSGKIEWPQRGVYLFFEEQERRTKDSAVQRVTRVGTHAVSSGSSSTLWTRLRAHKGASDGSGNHRGSIFRLHVGAAIQEFNKDYLGVKSWGQGEVAPLEVRNEERDLEKQVSQIIGQMSILWLAIADEPSSTSDRSYIERNSIALLSNCEQPVDAPSAYWLGRYSCNQSIRCSGLWNIRHIMEKYDARFLDVLEEYVEVTLGRRPVPDKPLAPKGKRAARFSPKRANSHQLHLALGR